MNQVRWFLLAFAAILAALVSGTMFIERHTIDNLLQQDAASTGRDWADYLATGVPDLPAIASGAKPSADSIATIEQAKIFGKVFLYKIYDRDGTLRLSSDRLPTGPTDVEDLPRHNASAALAINAGGPLVEVKEGQPPTRPAFFAEAYVPVLLDGKIVAVAEAYVDQTVKRNAYHAGFLAAALWLSLLIATAFSIPAIAWYFRDREKQRAEARIRYLAYHDALTDLPNRNRAAEFLGHALSGLPARRTLLALHSIDLDRFKDVNDSLGHDAGDTMIKEVADRLRSVIEPTDLLARLGGDEFQVVQTNPADSDAAEKLGERMSQILAKPFILSGHKITSSGSVGIALAPSDGCEVERLQKCADLALYKSKGEGGGRVTLFTPDLEEDLRGRLELERVIRDALENDGFVLHFQPLFQISGRGLLGFEALLRLAREDGSLVPPAVFVPLAEKMGLIDDIGSWVLRHACTTAASWPEHLFIAVNLSPAQFEDGHVADTIAQALNRSGLAPQRLELEITEGLLMKHTEAVLNELNRIKALGASIVMDDFGTGYSSLSYLWRFSFDKIKIDGAFMRAYDAQDEGVEKIVRTIVALGRSLKIRVTAEGVENLKQASFIQDIQCDEVQGYFFGRPVSADNIAALILEDYRLTMVDRDSSAAAGSHRAVTR